MDSLNPRTTALVLVDLQKGILGFPLAPHSGAAVLQVGAQLAKRFRAAGAQVNISADIIEKLNKEINAGVADPKLKGRFADLGGVSMAMTPAEFGKFIADETEKWGKVIKSAGIKPD